MNMEHSWILILAMIGHVLCVYADRLLLCTPGGHFSFSDMKDNARMAKLFRANNSRLRISYRRRDVSGFVHPVHDLITSQ